MKRVLEVVVVEGRYDRNAVAQAVDCTIIETSGFGVFSDKEKVALLRRLAEKRGLIVLTDSDSAGFFIRGRLRGMLGDANVKHAYIPDVRGRERRKPSPSSESKIGVEGMSPVVIIKALENAGATFEPGGSGPDEPSGSESTRQPSVKEDLITKTDLYELGLSGNPGSAERRRELLQRLDLPEKLSANALLDVLNILYTRNEFLGALDKSRVIR